MTIADQLPVLPIILPLVLAPFAILLRNGRAAHVFAVVVCGAAFAFCAMLLARVTAEGVISYALGDWAPPIGIEYRVDLANALVMLLVSGVATLAAAFSYASIRTEIDDRQLPLFYAAFMICMTGLLGVTVTGDAFNVFVFLEISSLSTYALVALGARVDRRALTAAFNYLVMGTLGATFFVIGLGLIYQATGTLNMADIRAQLSAGPPGAMPNSMVEAAFAFILVGMGLKAAAFPMHLWMPNAYAYAPSAVSAFIAAASTKVAVYVLIRFTFTIFGSDFDFIDAMLTYVLTPIALAGMFFASIVAVFQEDVKRMLAYSSVGQIGYMLLGISFGTEAGLQASLIHIFNHGLMKSALFMAVACVMLRLGVHTCSGFHGLTKRMPFTAAAFIFSGLSLVGVPLTVGFVSKWYLLQAAFDAGRPWAGFLIVASSLIAVVYVGRVIELILLRDPPSEGLLANDVDGNPVREAPLSMLIPMWVLVGANIYFGLRTDLTAEIAGRAAAALMGGAQ
ncbi:MAG: monovalent cation/H+ antiporter subunit D family protein [Alphaproteobacteria bacterium]|nr:monovalent cation/H+ antiporter subunit D family protein [Alphaproteobacteria bacterium]